MTEIAAENRLKYENYKEQFKRLKCALANGFNLEAMFIEYAIMEDRNRLIHALLKQQFAHNEISELAIRGNELVKTLRSRSGSYNRAAEKAKASI